MLPTVLVLLFAGSALSAPSTVVNLVPINEIPRATDNGRLVSSYLTDSAFEIVDGGDTNIYILSAQQVINDQANQADQTSQAVALAQTIAILGELANGVPGDACGYIGVINAEAQYRATGNPAALRAALPGAVDQLSYAIDNIVKVANDPNSQRYSTGYRGNCGGSGRVYQLEAVWDQVLANASPYQATLATEQYCNAKRLYSAFNVRSNNVGAAVTAASVPTVVEIFQKAIVPTANFLRAIASGNDASASAAVVKSALRQAIASVRV